MPWGHRSSSAFLWALCLVIERWWRLSTISTRLIQILFCCHESSVTTSWQLRRRALYQSSKSIQTSLSADKQYLTWSVAFMADFWVLIYMDRELLLLHQHKTSLKNQSCVHIIMQSTWDSNSKPAHSLKILKNINNHKNKEEILFILSNAAVIKERHCQTQVYFPLRLCW